MIITYKSIQSNITKEYGVMFKNLCRAVSIFAIASCASLGMAHADEVVTLKLGDFEPLEHILTKEGTLKWIDEVERRTNGTVKFEHYPAEQAAPAASLLNALDTGLLDIALIGPSYYGSRLPLNGLMGLPGLYVSSEQGSAALQEVLTTDTVLAGEFKNNKVVPIYAFVLSPYQVLTRTKKMDSLEDWKGLNVRTNGATQTLTANLLGAGGITLPGPEVYTGFERGRINAIFFPLTDVSAWKLNEVAKYISRNAAFGGYSFVITISDKALNKLTEAQQKVLFEVGEEVSRSLAQVLDRSVDDFISTWQAEGIDVYEIPPKTLEQINDKLAPVEEDWIKRVGGDEQLARKALDEYKSALKN